MEVTIIGAGLAGSLLSVFLGKKGYRVTVYEKRADPRKTNTNEGRSINLALSTRGWKAIKAAGLLEEVHAFAIPMWGRMIHKENQYTQMQYYSTERKAIYAVSRQKLNQVLINEAENTGKVSFYFDYPLTNIDWQAQNLQFTINKQMVSHTFTTLIGADGTGSAVRRSMAQQGVTAYATENLDYGYKELSMPPQANDQTLFTNALHIWPRKNYMLIALPNTDGSFTCTLFLPYQGAISFETIDAKKRLKNFFYGMFPDAYPLLKKLQTEYFDNPTGTLTTLRSYPWHYEGKGLLIGDAAHAIVPFYGQGMNAGFEDCLKLMELWDQHQDKTIAELYRQFTEKRKPDTDAIADLALQNFVEMRDKVTDQHFLAKKELEKEIAEALPGKWIPLYSMITFSDMPYAEALKKGKRQDAILEHLMAQPDITEAWKKGDISKHIEEIEKML